jgi:hypothetical protein
VWLDANDNGVFEAPGELLYSSLGPGSWSGSIVGAFTVPPTAVAGQPLRLRVVQWWYTPNSAIPLPAIPGPCVRDETAGQVRDFSVIVTTPLAAAAAATPAAAWQLAPNPASGQVAVHGRFAKPTLVEVWDALGQSVYRATRLPDAQNSLSLDLSALPAGLYLVRVDNSARSVRLLLE